MATARALVKGSSTGYYSGDPLKLFEDLAVLKPSVFVTVPRILNRVYARVWDGVRAKGGISEYIFNKGVADKTASYVDSGNLTHWFHDRKTFKNVKEIFGGNLRVILSGSAPLDAKVHMFFRVSLGI